MSFIRIALVFSLFVCWTAIPLKAEQEDSHKTDGIAPKTRTINSGSGSKHLRGIDVLGTLPAQGFKLMQIGRATGTLCGKKMDGQHCAIVASTSVIAQDPYIVGDWARNLNLELVVSEDPNAPLSAWKSVQGACAPSFARNESNTPWFDAWNKNAKSLSYEQLSQHRWASFFAPGFSGSIGSEKNLGLIGGKIQGRSTWNVIPNGEGYLGLANYVEYKKSPENWKNKASLTINFSSDFSKVNAAKYQVLGKSTFGSIQALGDLKCQ